MGYDLSGLSYQELCQLEYSMSSAVETIRLKKVGLHHVLLEVSAFVTIFLLDVIR